MDKLSRYLLIIASAVFLSSFLVLVNSKISGIIAFFVILVAGLLTIIFSIRYAKENIQVKGFKQLKNLIIPFSIFVFTVMWAFIICPPGLDRAGCGAEFGGISLIPFFAFWLFIFLSVYIAVLTAKSSAHK